MSKLKNYTSTVPAITSIGKIQTLLVENGATGITMRYNQDRVCEAILFHITVNDKMLSFHLSANLDACYNVLLQDVKRPTKDTYPRLRKQAEITAWKIVSDWVEVQMAMIQMDQAKMIQLFLAYVYDESKNQTFYDKVNSNLKLLQQ